MYDERQLQEVRSPVEFVVTRHLLTHPEESPAEMARHCHSNYASVALARRRLDKKGILSEEQRLAHLLTLPERPRGKILASFRSPNPDAWLRTINRPYWLSGEDAAAHDGYPIVPERHLVYVRPDDFHEAVQTALRLLGRIAYGPQSNLTVRQADPWLYLEPGEPWVERGQRLLDYIESQHVQLARSLLGHA